MLHFISNIICFVIPNKKLRDKVRVMIRYPRVFGYVRFVRNYARNMKKRDIQTRVGRGCKNFVVLLNDKYVFKFPLMSDGVAVAQREKRITDALRPISPIKIPDMKIMTHNGIAVRRYEFAHGTLLSDVEPRVFAVHRDKIAKQIAKMIYTIGESDPESIRDLKPTPNAKPDYLYGWFQGDIWQNFMLDDDFNITYFIDWEDTAFQSFLPALYVATRTWEKRGYAYMGVSVMAEYSKLYFKNHKRAKSNA